MKLGDNVPLLIVNPLRSAFVDAALVTVIVYVFVVLPSSAVTFTSIVFDPTFNDNDDDAMPLDAEV